MASKTGGGRGTTRDIHGKLHMKGRPVDHAAGVERGAQLAELDELPPATFGSADAAKVIGTLQRCLLSSRARDGIATVAGLHGVRYSTDEDGQRWATAGFMLAGHRVAYAELDDGTYGVLCGLRVAVSESMPENSGTLLCHQRPSEFDHLIDRVALQIAEGHRPDSIDSPEFGRIPVEHTDPDDDEEGIGYAVVRFELPDGMLAEIDDCTYGRFHGVRIFYNSDD